MPLARQNISTKKKKTNKIDSFSPFWHCESTFITRKYVLFAKYQHSQCGSYVCAALTSICVHNTYVLKWQVTSLLILSIPNRLTQAKRNTKCFISVFQFVLFTTNRKVKCTVNTQQTYTITLQKNKRKKENNK